MLQKAINEKKNFIPEGSVIHTIKAAKKEKQVTQNSSKKSLGLSSQTSQTHLSIHSFPSTYPTHDHSWTGSQQSQGQRTQRDRQPFTAN